VIKEEQVVLRYERRERGRISLGPTAFYSAEMHERRDDNEFVTASKRGAELSMLSNDSHSEIVRELNSLPNHPLPRTEKPETL